MEDDVLEDAIKIYRGYSEKSLGWVSESLDFKRSVHKSRLGSEHAYYIRATEKGLNTISVQVPIDKELRLAGLARVVVTTAADIHAIVEMSEVESVTLHAEISPELPELYQSAKRAPKAYSERVLRALIRSVRKDDFDHEAVRCNVVS
ncbi:hypothetical protein [Limimaricola cinnabarinus]|uniref:hypothetical protein n=1 Tax=Limimaricola cinnabarinus TaxID=1125964 RepID=UPI0005EC43C4|nr:hypothetical protein [Limimaricola cinnabarinus]